MSAGKDDDAATVVRIVAFSAIVPLALLVAPLLTRQLIAERGLTPGQVGAYFLFELGGISLASLPALWWMRRFASRRIAIVAAVVFILGNLLSIAAPTVPILFATRLLAALAGGALMILCMNAAGASPNRDRLFGYWVSGQLVLGAIGLWLLPSFFARFGLGAFYGALALLMALLLPLALRFDVPRLQPTTGARVRAWPLTIASMAAVAAFYVGLGGTWAFIALIADHAGIDPAAVGGTLAVASLLGIVGALLASGLGGRASRRITLPLGLGLMIAAVLLLLGRPDLARFTAAACLFKFAWTFALPFILAAIASRDAEGGLMAAVNLVIGAGNALGPVIGGRILERGSVAGMLLFSVALVAVALVLLLLIEGGLFSRRGVR